MPTLREYDEMLHSIYKYNERAEIYNENSRKYRKEAEVIDKEIKQLNGEIVRLTIKINKIMQKNKKRILIKDMDPQSPYQYIGFWTSGKYDYVPINGIPNRKKIVNQVEEVEEEIKDTEDLVTDDSYFY